MALQPAAATTANITSDSRCLAGAWRAALLTGIGWLDAPISSALEPIILHEPPFSPDPLLNSPRLPTLAEEQRTVLDGIEHEIATFERYSDYYGYAFYVMQREG